MNIYTFSHPDPARLRTRIFLFEPDGTLRRVSERLVDRLIAGIAAIPQFSGLTLRTVHLRIDPEPGVDREIIRFYAGFWVVDEHGRIDADLRDQAMRKWNAASRGDPDPLVRPMRATEVGANNWEPTAAEMALLIGAVWPSRRPQGAKPARYIRESGRPID